MDEAAEIGTGVGSVLVVLPVLVVVAVVGTSNTGDSGSGGGEGKHSFCSVSTAVASSRNFVQKVVEPLCVDGGGTGTAI